MASLHSLQLPSTADPAIFAVFAWIPEPVRGRKREDAVSKGVS